MDAAAEIQRVSRHIAHAEQVAARRDVSGLGHLQRILRQLLLRALASYRAEGRFPVNRDFPEQTPYFVDASGVRCAMAHLLELGGEGSLVERIARERNNAYVRELADEPRLLAWLQAAGFTVEEAAAIQPAYCSLVTDCICGGDFSSIDYPVPALGVLEGVVQASGMARVERTYGDSLGIAVGSDIQLVNTFIPVGTRILAPIDSADTASFGAIALDAGAGYSCSSQGVSSAPELSAAEFVQAVLANDCVGTLHELDSAWRAENDCDGGNVRNDMSCSASGGDPMSVGILLAVVAAFVRRAR